MAPSPQEINKTHTTLGLGPALVVARPDLVRRPRQAQMHVARREDRAFRIDELRPRAKRLHDALLKT